MADFDRQFTSMAWGNKQEPRFYDFNCRGLFPDFK